MKERMPTLKWAAGGLLAIGLISRFLGVVREMLVANYFGTSAELDAVFLGLAVPMALTLGIGGGLSRAVVPIAAPLSRTRFAGFLYTGTRRLLGLLSPLAIVLAITAPLWVNLLAIGEDSPPYKPLVISAIVGSLMILFCGPAGLYMGLANARGRHVTGGFTVLAYNIIVCLSIYLMHDSLGVLSVLFGIFVAEGMQIVVIWPVVRRFIARVTPKSSPRDWSAIQAIFWPTALVGILHGLNVSIDRAFATILDTGSIAALSYGEKLVNVPVSLLGTALAVPLYTRLSHYAAKKNRKAFDQTLLLGLRILILAGAPLGILLAGVGQPLISILLERGEFTHEGVALTSTVMLGYAVGVPFQIMVTLLISACMSVGRNWSIVTVMVITALLNAYLDWVLVGPAGLLGITLSSSIVSLVRVILLTAIVAPELFRSRTMLTTSGVSFLYGATIAIALYIIQAATHLFTTEGRVIQFLALFVGGFITLIIGLLLWKPMLGAEWHSLSKLRARVATHAELRSKR